MIRLLISEWDGRHDYLQTTAKHNVVWSIWAGDHGELSCAHLIASFTWNMHFGLSWLITGSATLSKLSSLRAEHDLLPGCCTIVPVLQILFSRLSMTSSFQPLWEILSTAFNNNKYNNHRLRGSASTVLTATGQVNGKWRILTPHRIETHEPTATKFRTIARKCLTMGALKSKLPLIIIVAT